MAQQQQLRAESVIEALDVLYRRISERFPGSSLATVCDDLIIVAKKTARRAKRAGRPSFIWLALVPGVAIVVGLMVAMLFIAPLTALPEPLRLNAESALSLTNHLIQNSSVEAVSASVLALIGAQFSLSNQARKSVRRFVFKQLHELRSFAHVIDMHQLTKDPVAISQAATRTASSPERSMTPFELARYLDYCAEMLSLTSKLAALYGEETHDAEITSAVNEIETLTAAIARKIWQKIMMLDNDVAMD